MIAYALLAALIVQSSAFAWYLQATASKAAEERRFLINQALSSSSHEFAIMAAAARPDDVVEALAEARTPRPSTPAPLGL
jgi:hypothetical protein